MARAPPTRGQHSLRNQTRCQENSCRCQTLELKTSLTSRSKTKQNQHKIGERTPNRKRCAWQRTSPINDSTYPTPDGFIDSNPLVREKHIYSIYYRETPKTQRRAPCKLFYLSEGCHYLSWPTSANVILREGSVSPGAKRWGQIDHRNARIEGDEKGRYLCVTNCSAGKI